MSDVVERAKAALEGVTRGPWRVGKRKWPGMVLSPHGCVWHVWHPSRGEVNSPADGEFIAAARDLVPDLIAEVERLQKFSRCPRCVSTNTSSVLDEESPSIACHDCGYGT